MRSVAIALLSASALGAACSGNGDDVASNGGSAGVSASGGSDAGGGAAGGGAAGAASTCEGSTPPFVGTVVGQSIATGSMRASVVAWDAASDRYVMLYGRVLASGAFRTEAVTLAVNGSSLSVSSAIELLDPALPTVDSLEREIVIGGGKILALLEDTRQNGDPAREVMAQFLTLDSSNNPLQSGASFSVSTRPNGHEYTPAAAWDPGANQFFVSWSDDREEATVPDGRLLFGRSVDANGALGPEVKLGGTSLWQTGGAVAGSGGNGRFLAAWGDYDLVNSGLDSGYRARVLDATGQPVSGIVEIARFGDKTFDPVALAWQPCTKQWLVAWRVDQTVYGSFVELEGNVTKKDFVIGEHAQGAGAPRLVWLPSSNGFALTFHAWTTENAYLQILDDAGNRVAGAVSVNADKPPLGTFWHPIAASEDRAEVLIAPVLDYADVTASLFSQNVP